MNAILNWLFGWADLPGSVTLDPEDCPGVDNFSTIQPTKRNISFHTTPRPPRLKPITHQWSKCIPFPTVCQNCTADVISSFTQWSWTPNAALLVWCANGCDWYPCTVQTSQSVTKVKK